MSEDIYEGIGGSYVLNKDGLREKVDGTADKLGAPAVVEQAVVEPAPAVVDAPAKEK